MLVGKMLNFDGDLPASMDGNPFITYKLLNYQRIYPIKNNNKGRDTQPMCMKRITDITTK
ncbi:MAG: hypothetical protein JWQ66_3136 [Mucilaginibacter sp.]|nr:hypothetical protein [Mucilaginibacter sp.]